MGYPLGISGRASITEGIVSALRYEEGNWFIQTDAPINPGSSEGPLLSRSGDVLGINTYKIDSTESGRMVEGIGFALSEKTFNQLLTDLKTGYFVPPTPTAAPTPTSVPRPSWPNSYIASIDGTVEDVRFWEEGAADIELGEREYNSFFKASQARYICWELKYSYPELRTNVLLTVHFQLFKEGVRESRGDTSFEALATWRGHYQWQCYGANNSGSWDPGFYEVDFFIEGDFVARESFEVCD